MEAITITLNGREVSGRQGMSILELARESGVEIPTLCYDPHLAPIGACRICMVEDERSGRLFASCVTPIESGMVINTESPKVQERRKTIIKLMLASHPDSCLVCDKGNQCELRKIASDMGVGWIDLQRIPQLINIEEVNPFIERDLSKCILCARCIRADHELVVQGAIDYINRGFATKPATLYDLPLEKSECTFCGTCVAICPTGALMEKKRAYSGTAPEKVSTICPFCGCGCSVDIEVKDSRLVRARPGKNGTVNRGTLCVKGSYGYDFVHSPDRLTLPLKNVDGDFEAVPWEQALERVASEFKRIRETYGPDSIAVLGSTKCTNEDNYLLQRFTRSVLGTNNIDNGSRLYSAANIVGLGSTVGFPGSTNHLDTLEHSEVIMVFGANLASSAPIVSYAVKRAVRNRGAKLIFVDPQQTALTPFAHIWLKPRPGSDVALINGIARVIVDERLLDEEYVTRKTDKFEELNKALGKYTPEYVTKATGVPGEDLSNAARLFAGANFASIVYGSGITQHVTGTDSVRSLANLAMLTGNIGLRGGIFALQEDCNGQGACDMGAIPNLLPGYICFEDTQSVKKFADRWGADLLTGDGLTAVEMIEQAKAGKIKGMYIVGENPVISFPNSDMVKEALASLDFLVVQDMFLTDTATLANVVLPAASFAEKEGTFTNFEGRVQRVHKVINPLGDSLPDWEIVLRLASEMGCQMPYNSLQQVMDEIQELVPLYHSIDITSSDTRDVYRKELKETHLRKRRLYKGQFPSGFGRFSTVEYEPQIQKSKNGYSFTLLSGSVLHHSGTGSKTSRATRLRTFSPEAYVNINESDANRIGISEGDNIKITSPVGTVTVAVRFSNMLLEGMVFMPDSYSSTPVHQLFDIVLDPKAKTPALKTCAVRLERI